MGLRAERTAGQFLLALLIPVLLLTTRAASAEVEIAGPRDSASAAPASDEGTSDAAAEPGAGQAVDAASPAVLRLRTEFNPVEGESPFLNRFIRELGRQAVLLAARDELGLATRDETLWEPLTAAGDEQRPLMLLQVRYPEDTVLRLSLSAGDAEGARKPWVREVEHHFRSYEIYLSIVENLEPLTRGDIVEALRSFGFEGDVPEPDPNNRPPDSVLALVDEMNFVSQYAAVRAAHTAIAKGGQSPGWLGVLVRGYAHLAWMTQHHWASSHEAFGSRSLLYAERWLNAHPDDRLGRAHRAYARAIIGLHAAALADLAELEQMEGATGGEELPSWVELISPYCRFERRAVLELAEKHAELAPLAHRLSFEQTLATGDKRWLYEASHTTIAQCPEEYGAYCGLAESGQLMVKRIGASYGPAAFGHFLPARIEGLPDLPPRLKPAAGGGPQPAENGDDAESAGPFSARPAKLAAALVAATEVDSDLGEPSWAVLGRLVEEEQFVMVANYFHVRSDAVESSAAEEVAALLPLVKNHRYAKHIEGYSVDDQREATRFAEIVAGLEFFDPRGNMGPMFNRTWTSPDKNDEPALGQLGSWHGFGARNYTLPGMIEALEKQGYGWWSTNTPTYRRTMSVELNRISPYSPQALRFKSWVVPKPTVEQLREWEETAGEDPEIFVTLGSYYAHHGLLDEAIRCYQQSIELSPTLEAYTNLANTYYAAGQEELWQPTLEQFLEVEDLGLEHARIHQLIANYKIYLQEWEEAEPHALAAAGTYSAWGLELAAEVYEGLDRWEESEEWIRKKAEGYPSTAAMDWYLWCRRTGRGNLGEARQLVERVITPDWIKSRPDGDMHALVYHVLEDQPREALPLAQKWIERVADQHPYERVYANTHLAVLALELDEQEIRDETAAALRTLIAEEAEALQEPDPLLGELLDYLCDLLDGAPANKSDVAHVLEQFGRLTIDTRRNFAYLTGRTLELHGEPELADQFYRMIIDEPPFNKHCRNLAGHRLAKRHGTSRP